MGQHRSSFASATEERVVVSGTTLTLGSGHLGKTVYAGSGGNATVTVAPDADLPAEVGSRIDLVRGHASNTLTVAAGSGVTIRNAGSALTVLRPWGKVTLTKIGANEWHLTGSLTGAFS